MPLNAVSYSSLRQWAQCPRLGYFAQYRGLQPLQEKRTGHLPFGSRVHLALELSAQSKWRVPSAQVWKKLMDREWEIADEKGWQDPELAGESKLGQTMLEGFQEFLESEGIFGHWKIVGIEKKLSTILTIQLANGELVDVLYRGKLDLLLQRQSDGAEYVGDYKTTGSLSESDLQVKLSESQGPGYVILQRRQSPNWVAGFVLILLRKTLRGPRSKAPYYQWHEEPYSDDKLDAALRNITAEVSQVASTVKLLDAGADHRDVAPYSPSWKCQSCPFKLPCFEMQQGNYRGADAMLLDLYAEGNPLQRYEDDPSNTLEGLGLV